MPCSINWKKLEKIKINNLKIFGRFLFLVAGHSERSSNQNYNRTR